MEDLPLSDSEFHLGFELLTPRQKAILYPFLQGLPDKKIAEVCECTEANIRKHISNICNKFGLREWDGSRCRNELIHLFIDNRPDLVSQKHKQKFIGTSPTAAKIENPRGIVPLESRFYVERPCKEYPIVSADVYCKQEIQYPAALLRIRGALQWGKSSLANRIQAEAITLDYKTVSLDLRPAGEAAFERIDAFWLWFCSRIIRKLALSDALMPALEKLWDSPRLGPNDKCDFFFENDLLPTVNAPLVLFLDNVDVLFKHPTIAPDVFSLLRAWYEASKTNSIWGELRLVLTYSTDLYPFLDINQSPFNVGIPITLLPFTTKQVAGLGQQHGLTLSESQLQQLMDLLGGHPYLVRLALYYLSQKSLSLDDFFRVAPTDEGPYAYHLQQHLELLRTTKELGEVMLQMMVSSTPIQIDSRLGFQLDSRGLIRRQGNAVLPLCDLYRHYFHQHLELIHG